MIKIRFKSKFAINRESISYQTENKRCLIGLQKGISWYCPIKVCKLLFSYLCICKP